MLLLMLDPQRDHRQRALGKRWQRRGERRINRAAPLTDLVKTRAADHPAAGARVAVALAFIITVEQKREALVVERIARDVVAQDKGLEKPISVRKMPFGGRGVGVRLDRRVGIAQRPSQRKRQRPRRGKARAEQTF